ncbi:glycosyltransferase family 2 protein [Leptothoe sp. PORK10 BA2]|uniref:glycosyltransferase family 2 protein n=1 Tax=Leptothoe sp. PORK10 BA2 TaxID=3110254 RepID=UPI002B212764|nr:glycosyltransferase family 2 protein [Leptothoe sp. PORK10 BA2]MEA5465529.1 glycosyltransferase family 2 protein [Leptothoe sp. PORK10 BA2]
MKLIIQIPCYNEENTLGVTLSELPRAVAGVDQVEWLIINDGSLDRTVDVAREWGVDHVVSFDHNQGLARGFMAGLDACLKAGADIIVNTDADNQYCAADIPKLIEPILQGQAEIVVGERPIMEIKHFSPIKKLLQRMGSWAVRVASKTSVADAPSGFRAISRNAAMQLNVFNEYTYTLETIIQAGQKGMAVASVPIRTNGYLRPSRLVKSIASYVQRSLFTILRIFITYRPLSFFTILGGIPIGLGLLLVVRWLWLFMVTFENTGRTHIPSLIFAAVLILVGVQCWIFGLIADLMSTNRKLLEDIQLRLRRSEIEDHMKKKARQ